MARRDERIEGYRMGRSRRLEKVKATKCIDSQHIRCKTKRLTSEQLPIQHDIFSALSSSLHACPHLESPSTPKTLQNHNSITPSPTLRSFQNMQAISNYRLSADNIFANALICPLGSFLIPSVVSPSSFPCPRSVVLVDTS